MRYEGEQTSESLPVPLLVQSMEFAVIKMLHVVNTPVGSLANILQARLMMETSASNVGCLPGEIPSWNAARKAKVRSLKGKYAFVPTSSEEFIQRKQLEIERES
jgi:hypothetical protein